MILAGLTGPDLLIALIGIGTGLFCLASILTALWIAAACCFARAWERQLVALRPVRKARAA